MPDSLDKIRTNPLGVDVVIATVGRPSLETAIVSALSQTYPYTRCVVVSDGRRDGVKEIVDRYKDRIVFVETERHLRRAGNGAKEFWYQSEECSPIFRYLDDDDWLPPMSIAVQVKSMVDPKVVLSICKMWMVVWEDDTIVEERSISGKNKVGHVGNGSVMVRKSAVKGVKYEDRLYSDFFWIRDILSGRIPAIVPYHLYWYNQMVLHGKTISDTHRADRISNAG